MSFRKRIQRKNPWQPNPAPDILKSRPFSSGKRPRESRLPTTSDILRTRPFASPAKKISPPKDTRSPEQIEAAKLFGYNAANIPSFAPSTPPPTVQREEVLEENAQEQVEAGTSTANIPVFAPSPTPPPPPVVQRDQETDVIGLQKESAQKDPTIEKQQDPAASLDGPLEGVTEYWIPSTGTLAAMEDFERIKFFTTLLDPKRQPKISKVYMDVLATRGATVHNDPEVPPGSGPRNNDPNNNRIRNILENYGVRDNYDDVINEFYIAAGQAGREDDLKSGALQLVPWIEGSGITIAEKPNTSANKKPEDEGTELYEVARNNNAVYLVDKNRVAHIDLLDDATYNFLKAFILDLAERLPVENKPGAGQIAKERKKIQEIILDDHFGIHRDNLNAAIAKYRKNAAQELGINDSSIQDAQVFKWLVKRVTQRVQDLRDALAAFNVNLSISVNRFDFNDDALDKKTDPAMSTNTQDVATWIEEGLIKGTINVQIYRLNLDAFISEYNLVKNAIAKQMKDKAKILDDQESSPSEKKKALDYILNFPQISISIAQTGANWCLDLERLQEQAKYVNDDKNSILYKLPDNLSQAGKYQKEIKATVVGFDFHRFENLGTGAVKCDNPVEEGGKNRTVPGRETNIWGNP